MANRSHTARRPSPYLELGQQALDVGITQPDVHQHPFWCEVRMEMSRQRGDVSLDGLTQTEEFLVRALVHGIKAGFIGKADLEPLRHGDVAGIARTVYQSGALASYEAWLARQWAEQDRELAWRSL